MILNHCKTDLQRQYLPQICSVKETFKKWGLQRDELKRWSSHLLDNLCDCLICAPVKFQLSSKRFDPMTCTMPVQSSHHLSHEATQIRVGQFVWLTCSVKGMLSERNFMTCGWEMNGHGFESRGRYLKFFRCTYERIIDIVLQVLRSFLQRICSGLTMSLFVGCRDGAVVRALASHQ